MRMKKSYDSSQAAVLRTKRTYDYYMQRLHSIAISCFEWENLPDTIDERYLEEILFWNSCGVFFEDEIMKEHLFLNVVPGGELNVYGIPIDRRAYSANNRYQKNLTEKDSVIVYDNYTHSSILPVIQLFAERLTNIDMTIDNNLKVQKTPFILSTDEKTRLSAENIFMKIDSNAPVISLSNMADPNMIKVLKLDAPYLVDKLQQQKVEVLNECFNYLGIGGMIYEKKERFLQSEAAELSQSSIMQRTSRLRARQQGAEMINNMFGLDISVSYKSADNIRTGFEGILQNTQKLNEGDE